MNNNISPKIVGGSPAGKRAEADFYPTPPEATEALLNFLGLPKSRVIWEPACGEMDMVNVMRDRGYSVVASDISVGQDFLTMPLTDCDWIITNPPFSIADKFIERCAEHKKPFALLLKSQYWHAKKRYELFNSVRPSFVCPLTWRPDFLFKTHKKGGPLMDVMWCVWLPGYYGSTIYRPLEKNSGKPDISKLYGDDDAED